MAWTIVQKCERAAAVLLLLLTLPVIIASALLIRILSGRSPFIVHKRVGWRGSVLWMLKLRTMWDTTVPPSHGGSWIERIDDESGPGRKHPHDHRIPHAFARFCRRHSIDELPQLWHVIRGEMALVGPRPITAQEIRSYYGGTADEVVSVKPGIAGLWQTSGRNRLDYRDRMRLDLEFIRNRSARLYFRILTAAIVEVCTGANGW